MGPDSFARGASGLRIAFGSRGECGMATAHVIPGMRGSPRETGSSTTNHRVHGGTPRAQVCHVLAVPCPDPGRAAGRDAGCPGGAGVPARAAAAAGAAVPASGGPASGGARGAGRGSSGPAARGEGPGPGELVREAVPCRWDDEEITRLRGFLATVDDLRGRQGRVYPLEYLLALLLAAGMAGDGGYAAAEWAATAPGELLLRLGAPLDRDEAAPPGRRHHPPRTHRLRPGAVRRRAVRMAGCPGPGTAARHAPPPAD